MRGSSKHQKEYRSSVNGSAVLLYPRTSQYPSSSSSVNVIARTHFALLYAYRFGTRSRTGPPCSSGSGFSSHWYVSRTPGSYNTSSGWDVVYPSPQRNVANRAVGRICARCANSRIVTPTHSLSNVVQPVTQWNADIVFVDGKATSSSNVNRRGLSTAPSTRRSQALGSNLGTMPT